MAANIWLKLSSTPRPTIGASFSAAKLPIIRKSVKPRAALSEFPLGSKIMVKNLSYSTTENCLGKEFSNFGQIAEVKLVKDLATRMSKGFAFIQYTSQDEAMQAIESMDEKNFDGRIIFVELAKPTTKPSSSYAKSTGPPEEEVEPHY